MTHFVSNRGTNLTAADKILKKELEVFNANSWPDLQKGGLKWEFIPAYAPHRGGVWERIVALFNKILATMALRPLWQALWLLWQTLSPFWQALTPFWQALIP